MSDLVKCFSNSVLGVNLTTILIDMEPWFIAKEVATLLGYENTTQAIRTNVDELDQKLLSYNECKDIFGQNSLINETIENTEDFGELSDSSPNNSIKINSNGMKFINESGLYTLIARSNKPEARRFQRWVTSEVLPSIRKTGSYGLQITKEDRLKLNVLNATDPDARFKALSELEQYHTEQKKALEDKTKELEDENEIIRGEYYNTKQIYDIIMQEYPEALQQAKTTNYNKLRKALKKLSNEDKESCKVYKKHVENSKGEIEWRQEYYFVKKILLKVLDCISDNIKYIANVR